MHLIYGLTSPSRRHITCPKLVVSVWLNPPDIQLNLAVVLAGLTQGERLSLELHTSCRLVDVRDIAATLLDEDNPITIRHHGQYRVGVLGDRLDYYDGIPDVFPEHFDITETKMEPNHYCYSLKSAEPLRGETAAFRFTARIEGMPPSLLLQEGRRWLFNFRYADVSRALKSRTAIQGTAIPIAYHYIPKTRDGGFDIFIFVPRGTRLQSSTPPPYRRLDDIDYDLRGAPSHIQWSKFSWSPAVIAANNHEQSGPFLLPSQRVTISAEFFGEATLSRSVRVFISYSYDGPAHLKWIDRLASDLRQAGADVVVDRDSARGGASLPLFAEEEVEKADFVLVVCTPDYKGRADRRRRGVGYEGQLISSELFRRSDLRKFIPLLRKGSEDEAIPSMLKGRVYRNFIGTKNYQAALAELIKDLA